MQYVVVGIVIYTNPNWDLLIFAAMKILSGWMNLNLVFSALGSGSSRCIFHICQVGDFTVTSVY